jgi:hypothetical protein
MSKEFSYDTMLATVGDALADANRTLENIQMNTTNSDPWIIGTYKASEALEKFDVKDMLYTSTNLTGVFGAIEYVEDYEKDLVGIIESDLSDPEKVASMVAFINMECVLNDLSNKFDIEWSDELTDQQVDQIKEYINQQVQ